MPPTASATSLTTRYSWITRAATCTCNPIPLHQLGNNAYVVGSTDLDGNPRIVGGTVDIGLTNIKPR